ncbi:MAG: hypothetical protein CVV33_01940 [Methanomicrobiales archaeon HGW-Methanomicrobiales-4]|nr:MAG: hypothetical protein CVV33_01940 [Methanomicrobiales archaeon HGW-Methanomicrobiales-4]
MLIPSIVIFVLALVGLPEIFTKRSFHIFSWLGILGFFFLIGVIRPSLVEDPLRTLGYLFAPLCLIAGIGVSSLSFRISPHPNLSRVGIIGISLFCTCSLILTFPAPVFLGFTPHPNDILFDERQYTIAHSEDEIEGIRWLAAHHEGGTIYTDTNIYYATLWITQDGGIRAEKHPDRLNPEQFKNDETSYILISDRMFTTAKFGGWLYEKPTPVSGEEYQRITTFGTLIYEKGDLKIFQFPRILYKKPYY